MPYVINQEFCSACHQCRVECPVHAITFRNAKYWIDPEKCISCGKCVKVCHNACISNPEKPAPKAEPHEKIMKECDVGGGYVERAFSALTQALNEGYIAGVAAAEYV